MLIIALAAALAGCAGDDGATVDDGGGDGGADPFGNSRGARDASARLPSDAGLRERPTCGNSPFGAERARANVLLVIDKSRSMLETPDAFSTDKWSAMKTSLGAALGDVDDALNLGLALYPVDGCSVPGDAAADVPVADGTEALPEIMAALEGAAPSGGTPTAPALARALRYFTEGAGSDLSGERFVLLATDGGPNCNDALMCGADACTVNLDGECPSGVANCCDASEAGPGAEAGCLDGDGTRAQIEALAAAGVDTFVVGIPGSETYARSLDEFAIAGGRESPDAPPSYFAVSSAGDEASGLTGVLVTITMGLVTSCRLQLDSVPPDPLRLNVEIEGEPVPQAGPNGWRLDESTDPPTVVLLGETCRRVEEHGVESVNVVFGCPTVVE